MIWLAYYTKLVFNDALFLETFTQLLTTCHKMTKEKVLSKISSYKGLSAVWVDAFIEDINDHCYQIVTDSIDAFIKVYGSGDKADMNSPFWNEYTQSEAYNKDRGGGNTVYYRPKLYKSFDWENDSRDLVLRAGSGRQGVYKGFRGRTGDPSIITKTLRLYEESFAELFNSQLIPALQTLFYNGTFITSERVNI